MHSPITLDRPGSVGSLKVGGFGMDRQVSRKNTKHETQDFTQYL